MIKKFERRISYQSPLNTNGGVDKKYFVRKTEGDLIRMTGEENVKRSVATIAQSGTRMLAPHR
jgi:hypothetical protein